MIKLCPYGAAVRPDIYECAEVRLQSAYEPIRNKVVPVLTQPCADSCVVIIESAQPIAKHWKDFDLQPM